jgi:hypothetical protein
VRTAIEQIENLLVNRIDLLAQRFEFFIHLGVMQSFCSRVLQSLRSHFAPSPWQGEGTYTCKL